MGWLRETTSGAGAYPPPTGASKAAPPAINANKTAPPPSINVRPFMM
ncbi:MAG: hypothetical protein NTW19_23620 [Planctomycetota bacterium]|nr:hypothetical protein [Planctomycetota bacterium]